MENAVILCSYALISSGYSQISGFPQAIRQDHPGFISPLGGSFFVVVAKHPIKFQLKSAMSFQITAQSFLKLGERATPWPPLENKSKKQATVSLIKYQNFVRTNFLYLSYRIQLRNREDRIGVEDRGFSITKDEKKGTRLSHFLKKQRFQHPASSLKDEGFSNGTIVA
ncbi:MAG: hypothetical protein HYT78_15040 [Deltaproteobacteria bacterium]|nr:hypothetical protein [Deltaproteobacteria bacterium]